MSNLITKLEFIKERWQQVELKLTDPEVYCGYDAICKTEQRVQRFRCDR